MASVVEDDRTLMALAGAVKDPNPQVAAAAAQSLSQRGAKGVEALRGLLAASDSLIRRRALQGLAAGGEASAPAARDMATFLGDHDADLSDAAVMALSRVGRQAIPIVMKALQDSQPATRVDAARALAAMPPQVQVEISQGLVTQFRNPNEFVSGEAGQILTDMGGVSLPTLIGLFDESDPVLRSRALIAVGTIGDATPQVVEGLIRRLADPERTVRLKAAVVLGELAARHPDLVDLCLERLSSPQALIRLGLVSALGHAGPSADKAVPPLINLLKDPDEDVREEVANALAQMGTREAMTAVENFRR